MGLFDDVNEEFKEGDVEKKLEELDINLENISVDVEDGVTYITGSVESEEDLEALYDAFAGMLESAVTEIDVEVVHYYTVQDGDSPWAVAQEFWGDGNKYPLLAEFNDGKEALYTGDVLRIPSLRSYIGGQKLQVILSALGYSVGAIDGVVGSKTAAAVKEFQRDNDLTVNGKVDDDTRRALRYAFRNNVTELEGIALQFVLSEIGYNVGSIDGVVGAKTTSALKEFQNDNDLTANGRADEDTVAALIELFV